MRRERGTAFDCGGVIIRGDGARTGVGVESGEKGAGSENEAVPGEICTDDIDVAAVEAEAEDPDDEADELEYIDDTDERAE